MSTEHAGGPLSGEGEPLDVDAELVTLLLTPEGRADPYPHYARLREHAPVLRSALGNWIVTRYEDCQRVLRIPHFGKASGQDELTRSRLEAMARTSMGEGEVEEFFDYFRRRQSMLTLNPPDHTRLRGLVARAFTPNTVEELRPHVESLCDSLLDALAEHGAGGGVVDVMTDLAFPLPVAVIGELLGIPPGDRMQFQGLVRTATRLLEPTSTIDDLRAGRAAREEMERYFDALIADRRRTPGPGLLTELIAVSDGSDRLSVEEMIATAILLFAAGFETTTNLIGNGTLALLRHPGQLAALRAAATNASAVARAVEELLRWDSPVQLDGRMALEDAVVAGQPVAAGENVMTLLGSANRDPRRFSEPEIFDLERDEGPPMSFGSGIHYCLGAALARLEGQVCFARMLQRFPEIDLATEAVVFRDTITLRGLTELPVTLAPS